MATLVTAILRAMLSERTNTKTGSSKGGGVATNVLGIDPAAQCGFAHSDGTHGVWQLVGQRDKHPGRRLERFRRLLFSFKRDHAIDVIGVEDASFGSHNPKVQAMHNELIAIVKLCAAEWEVPVYAWKPNSLKKWLTGHGRADKKQMIHAVKSLFGIETDDDNIADAIAVMERTRFQLKESEDV